MSRPRIFAALIAALFVAQVGQADEGCPIAKAMGDLPQLTYKVGDTDTCCIQSANALAEKHNAAVTYVVAKQSFETEAAATVALADVTEKFVSEFSTPCKCDVSGKTTVAGQELCCDVMAAQTTKLVKAAMDKVEMTYLVGEKECHCPTQADTLAKEAGVKKLFVVNGESTCCNVQARLTLARAKYKAAVEALVAAENNANDSAS